MKDISGYHIDIHFSTKGELPKGAIEQLCDELMDKVTKILEDEKLLGGYQGITVTPIDENEYGSPKE